MVAESPNSSTLNGSLSYLLSKMSGSSLSPEVSLGLANQRFIMYFWFALMAESLPQGYPSLLTFHKCFHTIWLQLVYLPTLSTNSHSHRPHFSIQVPFNTGCVLPEVSTSLGCWDPVGGMDKWFAYPDPVWIQVITTWRISWETILPPLPAILLLEKEKVNFDSFKLEWLKKKKQVTIQVRYFEGWNPLGWLLPKILLEKWLLPGPNVRSGSGVQRLAWACHPEANHIRYGLAPGAGPGGSPCSRCQSQLWSVWRHALHSNTPD